MILTAREKVLIAKMKQDDSVRFEDDFRSVYQYEVEKPSRNEYCVSKSAIMCLGVEYFETPEEVVSYIES